MATALRDRITSPRIRSIAPFATSSGPGIHGWLIATCAAEGVDIADIFDPAAVDLLASRLRTPLQIEQHLTLALETGYQASEKPVTEAIAESVLSKQIDDLEPTLTRHGFTAKVLTTCSA